MKSLCAVRLAVLAGVALSCARLPNNSDQPITDGAEGRTYANLSVGFQVTIPKPLDQSWGMSVQTTHHTGVLPDGTSLQVYITGPRGRGGFQPTFSIEPFAVNRSAKLADLASQATLDFSSRYRNYRESAHRAVEVGGGPAEQWTFTAQTAGQGDRFAVTLLINGRVGYLIQGNGIEGYYPTDAYEKILKTFKFL